MKLQISRHHLTKNEIVSEEHEILRAQKDLKQFNILYDRYYVRIFEYIYQRVQTEAQAADITSDTFIKAMENLKSYKPMGVPFASWLFRIARNEIFIQYHKGKKIRQINFSSQDIIDITEEIEEIKPNKIDLVIEAIKQLNPEETELIEMKYFEKRSYMEIGNILELTENNAKVKTHRVVQKLRSIINS